MTKIVIFRIFRNFSILRNFSDSLQLPQLLRFPRFTATFNVFPEKVHVLLSKFTDLSLKYAVEQKKVVSIKNGCFQRFRNFSRFSQRLREFRNFSRFSQLFTVSVTFRATFPKIYRNFWESLTLINIDPRGASIIHFLTVIHN